MIDKKLDAYAARFKEFDFSIGFSFRLELPGNVR